jgi:putative membrane protein
MPYWVYEVGKTIHFIGLVSWFAALFYMPRLFIYHTEALEKEEAERNILTAQFEIMQRRLYHIIMTPAMIITFVGGFMMLFFYGWTWFTANIWMHWKLGLIILLMGYHFYNKKIMTKLAAGEAIMSSAKLRMFNEIATILLLGIVLLAVFKSRLDFIYAFVTIILFMILLMMGIKAYKRYRQKKGEA